MNRIKFLHEFRSKDSALTILPDGKMIYEWRRPFDPLRLDEIELDPEPRSQQVELGSFTVDPPTPLTVSFNFRDLTGSDPPGTPFTVPAGTLPLPAASFGPISSYEFISLASGILTLRIQNDFPFPVQVQLPFTLKNNATSVPIDTGQVASFSFGGATLSPNQMATSADTLNGVLVRNLLRLPPSSVYTPGSGGPVSMTPQTGLLFEITFSDILVDSARAEIPAQNVYSFQDSTFALDDSTAVRYASFRSGSFDLILQNEIDVDVDVVVGVKELYHRQTGLSYSVSTRFNGKGSVIIPLNAAFYELRTTPAGLGTNLTFSVGVDAIQSSTQRTLKATDFVKAEILPGAPLRPERLTGRIKPTRVSIETGARGSTLGDFGSKFKGTLAFDSLDVSILLGFSQGFPVEYDLRVIALNRESLPAVADSIEVPPPGGSAAKRIFPIPNQTTFISLGSTSSLNSFFAKFFPLLPDTFIARGSILLNPPDLYASSPEQTIDDTSRVSASVAVTFPLNLSLSGGELIDTISLGDEEKFPTGLVTKTQMGTMFFEITNGLPVQISFRAALLGNTSTGRDTLLWLPTDGPRVLAAAVLAPSGSVASPSLTRFSVVMTSADLEKFNQADALWYRLQIETAGGGINAVTLKDSDFVQVKASANLVYRVNER